MLDIPKTTTTTTEPNYTAIKQRQQATWAAGDYAMIGTTLQIVGERLCEAVDLRAGERVLDVAAGNGNDAGGGGATSRRSPRPTMSANCWSAAKERAAGRASDGDVSRPPTPKRCRFRQQLRCGAVDLRRDVHPRPAKAAELAHGSQGGRIGLASWTPDKLHQQLFKTLGKHVPPVEAGVRSPALWGTVRSSAVLRHDVAATKQTFHFRYKSPAIGWRSSGPITARPAAPSRRSSRRNRAAGSDIIELLELMNRGGRNSLVVPSRVSRKPL
jgi:hypothetical protein